MSAERMVSWTALACVLAFAAPAVAELTQEVPPADLQEASGRVKAVDPQMRTVALKTGLFKSTSFVVGADTMILEGSQKLMLGDLKAGDPVAIRFYTRNGQNIAQTIAVRLNKERETQG